MQDKVLKMALIGVGNMGKKYAQMIVSGEVLHMKLAAVVILSLIHISEPTRRS